MTGFRPLSNVSRHSFARRRIERRRIERRLIERRLIERRLIERRLIERRLIERISPQVFMQLREARALQAVGVGICGVGTVGMAVGAVLRRNAEEISRRAGRAIEVRRVGVRRERPDLEHWNVAVHYDVHAVVVCDDIDVVVELMGGEDDALALVMRAIEQGKHVVTANKAMIAKHGNAIFEAAQRRGVMVAFEAAVAGGIPLIKAIREGLSANRIEWVAGIINGTSNYILTEMRAADRDFADVLAEAQSLGYAEANPAFDIDGTDAAHKLTIIASLAFGIPLQFDRAYTEGVDQITRDDIAYAETLGYRIKHLGMTRWTPEGIELRVHPTLVPTSNMLASVDGVMNAVLVESDAVGPSLYYGPGAGGEPTASSVVADLIDVVRTLTTDPEQRVPHLAFQPDRLSDLPVLAMGAVESAYYLRIFAHDRPGVLARIASILSEYGISIEAILQKEQAIRAIDAEAWVPVIILTHQVREAALERALEAIEGLDATRGRIVRIRVEALATPA